MSRLPLRSKATRNDLLVDIGESSMGDRGAPNSMLVIAGTGKGLLLLARRVKALARGEAATLLLLPRADMHRGTRLALLFERAGSPLKPSGPRAKQRRGWLWGLNVSLGMRDLCPITGRKSGPFRMLVGSLRARRSTLMVLGDYMESMAKHGVGDRHDFDATTFLPDWELPASSIPLSIWMHAKMELLLEAANQR